MTSGPVSLYAWHLSPNYSSLHPLSCSFLSRFFVVRDLVVGRLYVLSPFDFTDLARQFAANFGLIARSPPNLSVASRVPSTSSPSRPANLTPVPSRPSLTPALEALAATSAPVKRHTSVSEKTWLHHLVQKHGDDVAAMATDLKLNVWQKTQGEIKRMIKKAGGVEKLQREAGGMDLD